MVGEIELTSASLSLTSTYALWHVCLHIQHALKCKNCLSRTGVQHYLQLCGEFETSLRYVRLSKQRAGVGEGQLVERLPSMQEALGYSKFEAGLGYMRP